jgi:hypothetical protein
MTGGACPVADAAPQPSALPVNGARECGGAMPSPLGRGEREGPDAKRREGEGAGTPRGIAPKQREPPLIDRCYSAVIAAENPLFSRCYFAVSRAVKTAKYEVNQNVEMIRRARIVNKSE